MDFFVWVLVDFWFCFVFFYLPLKNKKKKDIKNLGQLHETLFNSNLWYKDICSMLKSALVTEDSEFVFEGGGLLVCFLFFFPFS